MSLKEKIEDVEKELKDIKKTHRIGELNGKWSLMFRWSLGIFIAGFPFIVGFNVWVVNTLMQVSTNQQVLAEKFEVLRVAETNHYTKAEIGLSLLKLEKEIIEKFDEDLEKVLRKLNSDE